MKFQELVEKLKKYSRVIVTGPQRSGTTIASIILAKELGKRLILEESFEAHNLFKFGHILGISNDFVIQAPGMCHVVDQLEDSSIAVVFMLRDLDDIQASIDHHDWNQYKLREHYKYMQFFDKDLNIASYKLQVWNHHQKESLGERAFTLNYESLSDHPLWRDDRKKFSVREVTKDLPVGSSDELQRKLSLDYVKLDLGCGLNFHEREDPDWIRHDGDYTAGLDLWGNWNNLPLPDESIDEIHFSDTIEHIPRFEYDKTFGEINRMLKIGGHIWGTTPNRDFIIKAAYEGLRDEDWVFRNLYGDGHNYAHSHNVTFTKKSLKETFEKYGFEVDIDSHSEWIKFKATKKKNL